MNINMVNINSPVLWNGKMLRMAVVTTCYLPWQCHIAGFDVFVTGESLKVVQVLPQCFFIKCLPFISFLLFPPRMPFKVFFLFEINFIQFIYLLLEWLGIKREY